MNRYRIIQTKIFLNRENRFFNPPIILTHPYACIPYQPLSHGIPHIPCLLASCTPAVMSWIVSGASLQSLHLGFCLLLCYFSVKLSPAIGRIVQYHQRFLCAGGIALPQTEYSKHLARVTALYEHQCLSCPFLQIIFASCG